MMFKVYWTCLRGKAVGREFDDMSEALEFTQELRNIHHRKFVTLCSENPDNTTKMGVSSTDQDYNWKKRR